MNILLISPKPVDPDKSRLRRNDAQLADIATCTRSLLSFAEKNTDINVHEIHYSANAGSSFANSATPLTESQLGQLVEQSELVIDVSADKELNEQQLELNGYGLHIGPTFPGSFACNDILIQATGLTQQSDVVNVISSVRKAYRCEQPKAHDLTAQMHYASYTPLPSRVGDTFYKSEREHALIFLNYLPHERNEQTREHDTNVLFKLLHNAERLHSITLLCNTLEDTETTQKIADSLHQALAIKPTVWGLRQGDYNDIFSVIAKADSVFFGGSALYADAIIRGKPVYTWRSNHAGTSLINDEYMQFLDDGDRERMLSKQRHHLDTLLSLYYQSASIPNQIAFYEEAFLTLFNQFLGTSLSSTYLPNETPRAPWLINEEQIKEDRRKPSKLGQSLWGAGNSLKKFRFSAEPTQSHAKAIYTLAK